MIGDPIHRQTYGISFYGRRWLRATPPARPGSGKSEGYRPFTWTTDQDEALLFSSRGAAATFGGAHCSGPFVIAPISFISDHDTA